MQGIVFIALAVIYILSAISLVIYASRQAKKTNRNPWLWGGVTGFIMYNIAFWDFLPTLIVRHHYCSTRAGTFVHTPFEEWIRQNPGAAQSIAVSIRPSTRRLPGADDGLQLNTRFHWQRISEKATALPVWTTTESIVDEATNKSMADLVLISSGYRQGIQSYKFWMNLETCPVSFYDFHQVLDKFHKMGR